MGSPTSEATRLEYNQKLVSSFVTSTHRRFREALVIVLIGFAKSSFGEYPGGIFGLSVGL
jgi:hypothetical protein